MISIQKFAVSLAVVGSIVAYLSLNDFSKQSSISLFLSSSNSTANATANVTANPTAVAFAQFVSKYSKSYKD